MLDLVLLRLLKSRKPFYQLYGVLPKDDASIDAQTKTILSDFARYYEAYPSHNKVDRETFMPWFSRWHPTLKPEQLAFFTKMLEGVFEHDVDQDQRGQIMQWIAQVELATRLANLSDLFSQGELEDDLFSSVTGIADDYRKRVDIKFDTWIDDNIGDLMRQFDSTHGLKWRLTCLNNAMRPLQEGDFGIIAARPDQGKTGFIASEVTFLAPQLPAERNILWLNNEGPGRRIVPRLYEAALGVDELELKRRIDAGTAEKDYVAVVGRRDRIRVVDVHGKTNGQIEMMIEDHNAGVVVYDMIDNIKGFGDAARTDLGLEMMYQWARERAVKYAAIALATSQISNDGDNQMYPPMGALKDSKTGKQGACDFQLMIGSVDNPLMQNSRFLSLPKNKLRKPGGITLREEVYFDKDKCRYVDNPGVIPVESNEQRSARVPEQQSVQAAEEELDALFG